MSTTVCTDTGKRGYMDEHDATRALHRTQGLARKLRKGGIKGVRRQECRVYLCQCERYHLTSWSGGMLTSRTEQDTLACLEETPGKSVSKAREF